jgi:hypothetical protein
MGRSVSTPTRSNTNAGEINRHPEQVEGLPDEPKGPNADEKPASAGEKSKSYSDEKLAADEKSKGFSADKMTLLALRALYCSDGWHDLSKQKRDQFQRFADEIS